MVYALSQFGRKEYWRVVAELHRRGTREILNLCKLWCRNENPRKRELSADVLGQLGWRKKKFRNQAIQLLCSLLNDNNSSVIASAAFALGHRKASEWVEQLVGLKNHKRERVRQGVVFGLLCQEEPVAITALMDLSKDKSRDVRNWATFGIGSMIDTDTPKIRRVLQERLKDQDGEIRGEALVGLARRRHPQSIKWIMRALAEERPMVLYLEAAEILKKRALLPALKKIRKTITAHDDPYFLSQLNDAIQACSLS
jgi:HEAT repeat protein